MRGRIASGVARAFATWTIDLDPDVPEFRVRMTCDVCNEHSEVYSDDQAGVGLWVQLHTARTMHTRFTEAVTRQWVMTPTGAIGQHLIDTPQEAAR
ncbi:hypothetical protein ACH429_06135 [Streptomyces pathocidini]|uniref:DUF7848 domain-containing protein n=1 Tax=Streptomyces pathocidini TaxID=1650571 RepID=A0ABW7UQF3_9ACTN|nr:hypothetical protein [Streptomyces pathocidini]